MHDHKKYSTGALKIYSICVYILRELNIHVLPQDMTSAEHDEDEDVYYVSRDSSSPAVSCFMFRCTESRLPLN